MGKRLRIGETLNNHDDEFLSSVLSVQLKLLSGLLITCSDYTSCIVLGSFRMVFEEKKGQFFPSKT